MKRATIIAAWLLGTTVPALLAFVFFFGCCVLPFHHAMHHLMPLCELAEHVLGPGHDETGEHHDVTPATERQQAPLVATTLVTARTFGALIVQPGRGLAASAIGYRSFISLGAMRCDADVGSRLLLLDTFRI